MDTVWYTRGAFVYPRFYIGILLHDFRRRARISRYKCSESRCKTAISPQLLAIQTHFVGTGWLSASPHCNFISILGDRHFVRGGCVSWTSIHAALPPQDKTQKNFWTCRCLDSKKVIFTCIFTSATLIYQLSGVFFWSWSPPAPMHLPQYTSVCYVPAPEHQWV